MRYSALSEGKRLRGVLAVLGCTLGTRRLPQDAYTLGSAIELIHAYSLVHDDLPCMDNDDLRRGKPTCHRVYGEGISMLAGVGLLVKAFRLLFGLGNGRAGAERALAIARLIADAIGENKMIAGQALDLLKEGEPATRADVTFIHARKTAAFIGASLSAGAVLGGTAPAVLRRCASYGEKIGLAFQIADDILNEQSSPEVLGKGAGTDRQRQKATYPALVGLDRSRAHAERLVHDAQALFPEPSETSAVLRGLAEFVLLRAK
jgi:geranylgeranyl diphosphate synthase type II